jgi:cysteine-rich repeat protein
MEFTQDTQDLNEQTSMSETVAQRPGQARVVMVLLVAIWIFFEPAATQSTACGSADSGSDAVSGENCEGLYAGAHSGFTTKCGDGHSRADGCELDVDSAFKRHDADHDGTIDAQEARGMFPAIGIDAEAMGQKFEHVDVNRDGRLTIEEWEAAGNTHPTIAMRVTSADGFDERFPVESADFGAPFRQSEVSSQNGALSVASPIEACETLQGGAELYQDKIVLAIRGTCEFCKKAKAAQAAGAKAIMVANNDESLIHMTVGTCGGDVVIPSIMVPHSAGEKLKQLGQDAHVSFPVCPQGGDVVPGHGMETCDDGNTVSGDGCNSECVLECGNKVIDGQETCDDGNTIDGDGCSSICSLEPGFVECSPIGCTSSCGDGIAVSRPDSCDSAGAASCLLLL